MSVGNLEMAARVNEETAAADRELFKRTPGQRRLPLRLLRPQPTLHRACQTEQGLYTDARQAMDLLTTQADALAASMPDMSDYYLPNRLFLLLRFARWDDVLAEPAPHSKMMMTAALRHYARSLAYAGKGDRAKSLEEQQAFPASRAAIPQQTMFVFNPADKVMNVAALVLEARLARPIPTPQSPFGGLPWKQKMPSFMTTRHLGITGSGRAGRKTIAWMPGRWRGWHGSIRSCCVR